MGNTIIVKPNQSMLDVIIQAMGSLEAGMAFCSFNNISISDTPVVGTEYKIPRSDAAQLLTDPSALNYFSQNRIVIGTRATDVQLVHGMTVVLKPVLHSMYNGAFAPSVLGHYGVVFDATVDFININPLLPAYPADNKMHYETNTDIYAGFFPASIPEFLGIPMTTKHLMYQVPWISGQNIWMWNPYSTGQTITFEDMEGNKAIFAPVVFFMDHVPMFHEMMIATLQVDFVSINESTVTLRLTRSHTPSIYANINPPYGHVNMSWITPDATPYEDPANPGDPDIQLIDLPEGMHTLGVETEYTDDITPFTLPARSICTQVVAIS